MAIQHMFKEMDKIVKKSAAEYHENIERQNSVVQTRLYYTEQWVKGLVVKSIFKYLNIIANMPTTQFKSIREEANRAAIQALKSHSTETNWTTKLTSAGFLVLKGTRGAYSLPDDVIEGRPELMQVSIEKEHHNTIVLTFYQSYTQGQGTKLSLIHI